MEREKTLTLATGASYKALWCGISGISGTLFFDLVSERTAAQIIADFDNPEATQRITYDDGLTESTYEGYTKLESYGRGNEPQVVRLGMGRE